MGLEVRGKAVVLTNGTFLNGKIHIGEKKFGGGRTGEKAATGITEQLTSLGFESGRMKTGTPPRVDGRSLDYSKMEVQEGDAIPGKFLFLKGTSPFEASPPAPLPRRGEQKQRCCWITYTNPRVHDLLKEGFEQSPMFTGRIQGIGPRYCPSIEDKVTRFAERERHQIFVEPEGLEHPWLYLNGISTSLPSDVQDAVVRSLAGFEDAVIARYGYAVEYDFANPEQLEPTLQ